VNSQFINHITLAGERWDLLSWKFYGDATAYSPIIMANPGLPIEPVFEAGVTVAIPILEKKSVLTVDLPPWKLAAETDGGAQVQP